MASPTFPTFPSIDFSKMPRPHVPKVTLPNMPDMPTIPLPTIDVEAVTAAVKDAGYIAVGLAVLGVQKAQVRRHELRASLNDQFGAGKSQLAGLIDAVEAGIGALDARLVEIEGKVDDAIDTFEKRLPARAGAALGKTHEVVKVVRRQARTILAPAA